MLDQTKVDCLPSKGSHKQAVTSFGCANHVSCSRLLRPDFCIMTQSQVHCRIKKLLHPENVENRTDR